MAANPDILPGVLVINTLTKVFDAKDQHGSGKIKSILLANPNNAIVNWQYAITPSDVAVAAKHYRGFGNILEVDFVDLICCEKEIRILPTMQVWVKVDASDVTFNIDLE